MSLSLPPGSCDAHCHVFGPTKTFPYDPQRTYTPAEAPKEALAALHKRLGFDRAVIVQPACHGYDNSVTLDAIAASRGAYRGVALVRDDVDSEHIAELHAGGIRGVRFNFVRHLGPPPPAAVFHRIADLVTPLGWHIVLHVAADDLPSLAPYLGPLSIPFVIDHMGRINTAAGLDHVSFRVLLDTIANPRAWVKISAADRISARGAPFHDAIPYMRKVLETAPDRVLWGTDWPHPNIKGPIPDEAVLLTLLDLVAPEKTLFSRVLVTNPARLYGFAA